MGRQSVREDWSERSNKMYNYRFDSRYKNNIAVSYDFSTEYEALEHIRTESDLLHFYKNEIDKLLMTHEASLVNKPVELEISTLETFAKPFYDCIEKNKLKFPERSPIGPKYEEKLSADSEKYHENKGRRITGFIPHFFGIRYTEKVTIMSPNKGISKDGQYNSSHVDGRGWRPSVNPKSIMEQHRKLYDILFSCYDKSDSKTLLGNLTKPSIFRFDVNANGNYREAFDHIFRELIYRFPMGKTWDKLRFAMDLDVYTSKVRSCAFSIMAQLMNPEFAPKLGLKVPKSNSATDLNKYYDELYSYISNICSNLQEIVISGDRNDGKNIVKINMDLQSTDAIIYYAYIFFNSLQTTDYFNEINALFEKNSTTISEIISWSQEYRESRNSFVIKAKADFIIGKSSYNLADGVPYFDIPVFIEKNWNDLKKIICIDDFTSGRYNQFYEAHKDNMCFFIELYRIINRKDAIDYISYNMLIDLLHLYVRLKRCKINIPTASVGYYNGKRPEQPKRTEQIDQPELPKRPRSIKIDSAIQSLKEEYDNRANDETISDEQYMRNIIIETWLTSVIFMLDNKLDCELFLKRMEATKMLFYALMQNVPALASKSSKDVDFNKIVEDCIFQHK